MESILKVVPEVESILKYVLKVLIILEMEDKVHVYANNSSDNLIIFEKILDVKMDNVHIPRQRSGSRTQSVKYGCIVFLLQFYIEKQSHLTLFLFVINVSRCSFYE